MCRTRCENLPGGANITECSFARCQGNGSRITCRAHLIDYDAQKDGKERNESHDVLPVIHHSSDLSDYSLLLAVAIAREHLHEGILELGLRDSNAPFAPPDGFSHFVLPIVSLVSTALVERIRKNTLQPDDRKTIVSLIVPNLHTQRRPNNSRVFHIRPIACARMLGRKHELATGKVLVSTPGSAGSNAAASRGIRVVALHPAMRPRGSCPLPREKKRRFDDAARIKRATDEEASSD